MDREIVMQLAEQAGFGGNNRNTFGPKLIKFASLIEQHLSVQVQVCRPEDRQLLTTDAGKRLVELAVKEMRKS